MTSTTRLHHGVHPATRPAEDDLRVRADTDMTTPRRNSNPSADALPTSWERVLALSGIAFAVLFVVGWFISGSDTPDYSAAD
ncbi:MAG TPA: hypothetical protein VK390_10430, partial [Propionibacteriaceae bacterium]|nr:hypothetical protein [Propionibacteriaceae bacterium]